MVEKPFKPPPAGEERSPAPRAPAGTAAETYQGPCKTRGFCGGVVRQGWQRFPSQPPAWAPACKLSAGAGERLSSQATARRWQT